MESLLVIAGRAIQKRNQAHQIRGFYRTWSIECRDMLKDARNFDETYDEGIIRSFLQKFKKYERYAVICGRGKYTTALCVWDTSWEPQQFMNVIRPGTKVVSRRQPISAMKYGSRKEREFKPRFLHQGI